AEAERPRKRDGPFEEGDVAYGDARCHDEASATFTSPRRGEVELRSNSGDGSCVPRESVTPHPDRIWRCDSTSPTGGDANRICGANRGDIQHALVQRALGEKMIADALNQLRDHAVGHRIQLARP